MKTLTSKLKSGLRTGALLTSLAFASGCAGLGAVYMQSDDPATRAWGTLMHNEGSHEQRMKEQREGKPETNVNVNVGGSEKQQQTEIYNNYPSNEFCNENLGFYQTKGHTINTIWKKCKDGIWRSSIEGQIVTASEKEVEEFSRFGGNPIHYGENEKKERINYKSQFHTFEKYVDINRDGKVDSNEFFGLDKRTFEAGKDINFVYMPFNNEKKINFSLWNSQGERKIEREAYLKGDNQDVYFNYIRTNRTGDHKLVVVPDRGDTQIIDISIIENNQ